MAAPCAGIHPTAVLGQPGEHREHRGQVPRPYVFPSQHSRVQVWRTALLEAYVTVDAGIERATVIGDRAWLMKHVHVGHDALIGDGCELAPGTVIGGHASLGAGVRCGIGVLVQPYVTVGPGARLGSGAVVTRDVPAGEVWVGNPATEISRHTALRRALEELLATDEWAEWWERTRAAASGPGEGERAPAARTSQAAVRARQRETRLPA